jgi:hypothetical protein
MSGTDFRALGRRGGLTTAATRDMRKVAAHARKSAPSSLAYFYPEVDPDRVLDQSDREQRARAAQRLWFARIARKRKTGNETTAAPDKATAANTDHEVPARDLRAG